jgi:hypothetical protein
VGLLIGEVARRTGVSTSALRYYERAGLVPPPTTPAQRWRVLAATKLAELDAQMIRLAQLKSILNDNFRCRCSRLEDCEQWMAKPQKGSK